MDILSQVKMNTTSKSQDGQVIRMKVNLKQPLKTVIQTNNQCQKKAHYLFFRQKTGTYNFLYTKLIIILPLKF